HVCVGGQVQVLLRDGLLPQPNARQHVPAPPRARGRTASRPHHLHLLCWTWVRAPRLRHSGRHAGGGVCDAGAGQARAGGQGPALAAALAGQSHLRRQRCRQALQLAEAAHASNV
ncbi:hypothetical protein APUTEX25_003338, partial [Auxenochlorella protothecoides]